METIKIILGSVLAAVLYGILQDQVTARICVEYFMIGHPDVFGTDSPPLLAFGWGVIATWWAGLMLGIPLAVAARAGGHAKLTARQLAPTVGRLLLWMGAAAAAVAGQIGHLAGRSGLILLDEPLASAISPDRHSLFIADGAVHLTAYAVGFGGGVVVCIGAWMRRCRGVHDGLSR